MALRVPVETIQVFCSTTPAEDNSIRFVRTSSEEGGHTAFEFSVKDERTSMRTPQQEVTPVDWKKYFFFTCNAEVNCTYITETIEEMEYFKCQLNQSIDGT